MIFNPICINEMTSFRRHFLFFSDISLVGFCVSLAATNGGNQEYNIENSLSGQSASKLSLMGISSFKNPQGYKTFHLYRARGPLESPIIQSENQGIIHHLKQFPLIFKSKTQQSLDQAMYSFEPTHLIFLNLFISLCQQLIAISLFSIRLPLVV